MLNTVNSRSRIEQSTVQYSAIISIFGSTENTFNLKPSLFNILRTQNALYSKLYEYSTVQYSTIQYSTVHYSTVQYYNLSIMDLKILRRVGFTHVIKIPCLERLCSPIVVYSRVQDEYGSIYQGGASCQLAFSPTSINQVQTNPR